MRKIIIFETNMYQIVAKEGIRDHVSKDWVTNDNKHDYNDSNKQQ